MSLSRLQSFRNQFGHTNRQPSRARNRRGRAGLLQHGFVEQLESRMLLSAGLTAQYFSADTGAGLTGFLKTQVDTTVNFGGNGSAWDSGVPANFSARWEGFVVTGNVAGNYTFYTDVNGGVHLFLAPIPLGSAATSQEIINNWTAHTTEDASATVDLAANTKYAVKMEYISYSGSAAAELQWLVPGGSKTPIPSTNLDALDTTESTYTPTAGNTTVPTSNTLTGAPTGWYYADIDSPAPAGSSTFSNGNYTVNGGGTLDQVVNDQFQYAYEQTIGDFTFTAEINSMTDPNNGAMAGVMLRSGLTASVQSIAMVSEPSGRPYDVIRENGNATSLVSSGQSTTQTFPYWVQIVRYGNQVITYYAANNSGAPGTWIEQAGQSYTNLPQTVDIGLASTSRTSGSVCTAVFGNVSLAPLARSYETSFVGDSFGGGQQHVMSSVQAAYVDPSTGQSFLVGGDEDDSFSIYNNDGSFVAFGDNSHYEGGVAVTEDGNTTSGLVYAGQTAHYTYQNSGVQPYDHYGIAVRSAIMGTDTVNGLAVIGGVLYVATDNMVYGFNTSTLAFNGTMFEVAGDRVGSMAVDAAGTGLWIVQPAGSGGAPAADVIQYTISGNTATVTGNISFSNLSKTAIPDGIAVSPVSGNVYITDIGILQDIHIYSGNGTYVGEYGDPYGIYGTGGNTAAGSAAPLKFIFPVAVGIDSGGNVTVFNSAPVAPVGTTYKSFAAGTIIQKYSTTNTLLWQRDGLEYVDTADPDPASPTDLYSDFYHYQINYNDTTAGTETVLVGALVDPFATVAANGFNGAADPRLIPATDIANDGRAGESTRAGAQIREIDGSKFLFDFDQHASAVNIYRFQANTQFTVFCGELVRESDRGNQTLDGFYIWTDNAGEGIKLGNESFATGYQMDGGSREAVSWYLDANGNIWIGGQNTTSGNKDSGNVIREYVVNGNLTSAGAPIYTNYTGTITTYDKHWTAPANGNFTELCRAIYDAGTDSLYLSGYTTAYPRAGNDTSGGTAGTELFKYGNWTSGNGTGSPLWAIALPYSPDTSDLQVGHSIISLQVAGGANGYVFASIAMNNAAGIMVYSAATGGNVTQLSSGPEIAGGSTNGPDFRNCLTATQLSDGEYVLFNEEVEETKITMFRWTPNEMPGLWGDLNIGNSTGITTYSAIGNWTQTSTGGDISNASDLCNFASQLFTGDGAMVAEVDSLTSTLPWAKGGIMFRDGIAANAVNVALVLTKSNGVEFQDRTSVGGNTTNLHTIGSITAPVWLELVRNGNTFYAYYSTGSGNPTWTAVGNVTVSMDATLDVGTVVSADSTSTQNTTVFSNVQLNQALTNYNIGNATPNGNSTYNADSMTWTISGGGGDMWGASDQFELVSENYTGDGTVAAQMVHENGSQPWAKAGVMIRNDTTVGAAYAAMLATPGEGVVFQWRSAANGNTSDAQISGLQGPVWVEVIRASNSFSGYYSLNGFTWTQVGTTQTFTLANTAQVGFAVSAHGSGTLNTATFTNFSITTANTVQQLGMQTVAGPLTDLTTVNTIVGAQDLGVLNSEEDTSQES